MAKEYYIIRAVSATAACDSYDKALAAAQKDALGYGAQNIFKLVAVVSPPSTKECTVEKVS